MSDENKPDSASAPTSLTVQTSEKIPIFYANAWTTNVGQSDFTIQLGLSSTDGVNAVFEPVATIILTHANFMKFAINIGFASTVIGKLYGGQIPMLTDLSNETMEAAMQEVREQAEAFRTKNPLTEE